MQRFTALIIRRKGLIRQFLEIKRVGRAVLFSSKCIDLPFGDTHIKSERVQHASKGIGFDQEALGVHLGVNCKISLRDYKHS
jgi:hypothetical protein